MGAVMYAAAPWLIRLMGADGEFAHLALQYLRVYALCSPLTTIIFAVDNYLRISGTDILELSTRALQLFSLTYLTRWFSFATQSYMLAIEKPLPASLISVSTALVFPVILIAVLWPLGLTGIWLNFAGTSVLAAVLSAVILLKLKKELRRPDAVSESSQP